MPFDQFFHNPPIAYRLMPFWFWNDRMDEEEIIHQIREMAEKGIGGFFICARQGLETPYLSDQWFQLVATAVEAARQHGLHVWLYDEYPYPSGMSGGEVTLQHPEARHRQLLHFSLIANGPQPLSYELPWAKVLSARAIPLEGPTEALLWSQAIDLAAQIGSVPAQAVFQSTGLTKYTHKRFFSASPQKRLLWDVPPGHWQIMIFLESEIDDFKYFGTYVDPCHKEAIQTFLATTHERYAHSFHEQFGRAIKGFFTDEVGLLGRIPWSARLPGFVRKRHGYELVDHLPALFYPQKGQSERIKYQFFQSLHLLLNESYHQQVSKWCKQHYLQYMTEVPSMRMTTQLSSHVPGGDSAHEKVGRSLDWILENNAYSLRADPKIASSLANQLGSERAMIECFHSVGWSMTLQDAKWMLDRLAALGINFFVFHAFFYSINGLRKHDAPPSQFLQNPYWPHFRQLADYAARLSYAMSQGQACVSIAIVHPATSFWTHMGNPFQNFNYCGNDAAEEQALERLKQDWAYLCKQFLVHQIDYDHLDPELLARATIKDGQIIIGHARYEVLILPPLTNLEAAAWAQVKAFLQAGGKVISVGLLPYERIEQEQESEAEILQWFGLTTSPRQSYWQEFLEKSADNTVAKQREQAFWTKGEHQAYFFPCMGDLYRTQAIEHLLALLHQCTSPVIELEPVVGDRNSFLLRQRSLSKRVRLIFITHQEGSEKVLRLHLAHRPSGQSIEHLDLASGQQTILPVEQGERGWSILLPFAPYESHLLRYAYDEEIQETNTLSATVQATQTQAWVLTLDTSPWQLTTQQNNILRFGSFHFTLDQPRANSELSWREGLAGQVWPVVDVRPIINQCAEIASTQTLPVQFRQSFGLPMHSSLAYPLHCWYQTSFAVEQFPTACMLVMDTSAIGGNYLCYLNGHKITKQDFVPLHEHGFPQQGCEVRQFLKQGINNLVVSIEAQRDDDGLRDPLYLSGHFGVAFSNGGMPMITESPTTGELKSAVQAGYPYFAGTLCLSRDISIDSLPQQKTFTLAFREWDQHIHDCIEVLVNERSLGICCWSPYCWRGESALLRVGNNTIEFRLTNTLSGMLEGSYFDAPSHQIVPVSPPHSG
jgi:hypothetical protein